MHCTWRNVRIPLTLSDRLHRRCCVVLRSTTATPSTPFPRSNGSRGVPSGILLTTHIIFPRCRCAPRISTCILCIHECVYIYTYIHIHVYIYLYTHGCSRPPRLGHVGTKVPFIALLAYRVSLLSSSNPTTLFSAGRPTRSSYLRFKL